MSKVTGTLDPCPISASSGYTRVEDPNMWITLARARLKVVGFWWLRAGIKNVHRGEDRTPVERTWWGHDLKDTTVTYKEWLKGLKIGDQVRVCKPWNDRNVVGGELIPGVVEDPLRNGDRIRVRYEYGGLKCYVEFFHPNSGASGPYSYLIPVNKDVTYDSEVGLELAEFGTCNGLRREHE